MKENGAALIGVGMVAGVYASALIDLAPRIRLTGALGARASSAAAFLDRHPELAGARVYGSVGEIATDPDVGFAIVATPPNARRDIVAELAAAGKPTLMEKPVERSLEGARAVVETCEAAGVPLGIMLQHRARPSTLALRERLDDLGKLLAVEIAVPWWRTQAYYDEPGRGSYVRDGGGVMISQAIHALDLALTFAGPVVDVMAMCATTGFHRMDAEDFVSAGLRFGNGAIGTLFASTASYPGESERIALHHENGSARLTAGALSVAWQDGRVEIVGAAAGSGGGSDPMAFSHEWHRTVIADFDAALREGRAPLAPGRDALAAHSLIEAIERSGREGLRASVEPA